MDRVPAGLSFSILIAATSLGALVGLWRLEWPVSQGLSLVVHVSVALCFIWSLAGSCLAKYLADFDARPRGKDLQAVLHVAALLTGAVALVIMVYTALVEAMDLFRYELSWRTRIWSTGPFDIAGITAALVLRWRLSGNYRLIAGLFWLAIFAGFWISFQSPDVCQGLAEYGDSLSATMSWGRTFMLISATIIAAFTIAEGVVGHLRRVRAWPDELWRLTAPQHHCLELRFSEGVVAVIILLLGCVHITAGYTVISAFLAGGSMMTLAARRWEENLADAGLALITLGVVAICMFGLPGLPRPSPHARFAEIFTRALVGLAIMSWFWFWLAGVWKQQLDSGQAWTTAGRLIHITQRVGYMLGAAGVLISLHLTFWPILPYVFDPAHTSISRWIWGLSANGLLLLALLSSSRRTGKQTTAWLALLAVASAAGFVLIRMPHAGFTEWLVLHWPMTLPAAAVVSLLLATAASRATNWHPFVEPLYLLGVLVLPITSIMGISLTTQLMLPPWLPAATFASLGGVYLLAALVPGPGTYAAVALICGAVSIWHLRFLSASTTIPVLYFYGILTGLSVFLFATIYQHRKPSSTVSFLKWTGGTLVLISALAALIAPNS